MVMGLRTLFLNENTWTQIHDRDPKDKEGGITNKLASISAKFSPIYIEENQ